MTIAKEQRRYLLKKYTPEKSFHPLISPFPLNLLSVRGTRELGLSPHTLWLPFLFPSSVGRSTKCESDHGFFFFFAANDFHGYLGRVDASWRSRSQAQTNEMFKDEVFFHFCRSLFFLFFLFFFLFLLLGPFHSTRSSHKQKHEKEKP